MSTYFEGSRHLVNLCTFRGISLDILYISPPVLQCPIINLHTHYKMLDLWLSMVENCAELYMKWDKSVLEVSSYKHELSVI